MEIMQITRYQFIKQIKIIEIIFLIILPIIVLFFVIKKNKHYL